MDISFELDFDFNYGYKRLVIAEGQEPKNDTQWKDIKSNTLENQFSKVTLNSNGTFNLLNKKSGIEYYNLNTIEDCGDAGDTYNYSPVESDKVVTNKNVKDCEIAVKKCINKTTALVSYELQIPETLPDYLFVDSNNTDTSTYSLFGNTSYNPSSDLQKALYIASVYNIDEVQAI